MTQCPSLLATELAGDGPLLGELDDGYGLIPEKKMYFSVTNKYNS